MAIPDARAHGAMEVPEAVDASWTVERLRAEADRDVFYKVKYRARVSHAHDGSEWVALYTLVAVQRSGIVRRRATSTS